jgi:hypothetical protein
MNSVQYLGRNKDDNVAPGKSEMARIPAGYPHPVQVQPWEFTIFVGEKNLTDKNTVSIDDNNIKNSMSYRASYRTNGGKKPLKSSCR